MSSFLTAITFVCAALLEYDDEDESDWEDIHMNQISMMTSCCRAKYAT